MAPREFHHSDVGWIQSLIWKDVPIGVFSPNDVTSDLSGVVIPKVGACLWGKDARGIRLKVLFVSPSHRNHGIGYQLLLLSPPDSFISLPTPSQRWGWLSRRGWVPERQYVGPYGAVREIWIPPKEVEDF